MDLLLRRPQEILEYIAIFLIFCIQGKPPWSCYGEHEMQSTLHGHQREIIEPWGKAKDGLEKR